MPLYRKKPVVIEAEVYKLGMEDGFTCNSPESFKCENECALSDKPCQCEYLAPVIETLEGFHIISPGDYIITGVKGERYPCKPDIFQMTYEPVVTTEVGLTFGQAIEAMKKGHKVARKGWNGKGIFIELQVPDEHSKMTHPYIFIDTTGLQTNNEFAPKVRVPWLASQTDMLAEDWMIVD